MLQGEWGLASQVNESPPILRLFPGKGCESESTSALSRFKFRVKAGLGAHLGRMVVSGGSCLRTWGILPSSSLEIRLSRIKEQQRARLRASPKLRAFKCKICNSRFSVIASTCQLIVVLELL